MSNVIPISRRRRLVPAPPASYGVVAVEFNASAPGGLRTRLVLEDAEVDLELDAELPEKA